jgi:hypothetical protein
LPASRKEQIIRNQNVKGKSSRERRSKKAKKKEAGSEKSGFGLSGLKEAVLSILIVQPLKILSKLIVQPVAGNSQPGRLAKLSPTVAAVSRISRRAALAAR